MQDPYEKMFGQYSQNDGTVDFYTRLNFFIKPEFVVLDLGAGRAGWFEDDKNEFRTRIRTLKNKVKEVIAVDVDPAVLENQASDRQIIMDSDRIPLPDESVDIVIADYVLEHIENPRDFCGEVNRVLKSGGLFCARTPHKFCYIAIISWLVSNAYHSKWLRFIQPDRKDMDIFPTRYKLNTLWQINNYFGAYRNESFIYRADPAYFFGNPLLYRIQLLLHRLAPAFFIGNIFVFARKI